MKNAAGLPALGNQQNDDLLMHYPVDEILDNNLFVEELSDAWH